MSQAKKGKLGAAAQVVNAVKSVYNQAAPVTSTYTPLKASDRAAAGNAAARGIAQEPTIKASEAFGRAREKGFKRVYQTQADRTRVGGGNIGGPQFSALSEYDPNYADDVWGVMDEGTASRLKNLSSPEHLFTTMLGSEDQLKTNPVVFEKLKRLFMREVKAGNMPPALLIKINEKLANAKVGNEGPAMFGEGVDILDPDLWRNLDTFDKRAVVADMMRGEGVGGLSPYRMTKKGDRTIGGTIFDAPGTLRAETDPMLLHPEMGGDVETFAVGPRAFSLTGTSEYRPDKHPGFPTILHGKDQRVKYNPVPSRTFLKDWYKEWEASPNKDGNPRSAAEKKKGPGYYPLALGMEGKGLPSQEITDAWLKELMREGHAQGGEIRGGLAHMAPGGVIGTAQRAPTSHMGTALKPYTPPSASPYKAPPKPYYPVAPPTAPRYVAPPPVKRSPSPSVYTPPAVQPRLFYTEPPSVARRNVTPVPKPSLPSKYPSYVLPPAKPTGNNFNLSKMSTSVFQDGGEVHAASGGYYTAAQMKAFNVPTAKPVPAKPSNRALTGPQMQAMSAPVTKMVPTKPSAAYSVPTTSKVMTGPQIQGLLNKVPVAPTIKPAPLPTPAPMYKAPVKKPAPAPTSAKAVTGPMVQAKLLPVAQQLAPVVKKTQPSVRMATPVAKVTAPSTRASPSTASITSAIQAPAARMSSAMADMSSMPEAPATGPDAPREYITPKLVSSDPAVQAMLEDQSFLEWLKSQKPPTEEIWQPPVDMPPVDMPDDTYVATPDIVPTRPSLTGVITNLKENAATGIDASAQQKYNTVNALRDIVGLPRYNTYEEYKAGEGVAKGGSIRMAHGGSIPEGVIRHMKRAAIAARMHKAGGRVNG